MTKEIDIHLLEHIYNEKRVSEWLCKPYKAGDRIYDGDSNIFIQINENDWSAAFPWYISVNRSLDSKHELIKNLSWATPPAESLDQIKKEKEV